MGDLAVEHILASPLAALRYQTTDMLNSLRPGFSMAMLLLRDDAKSFGDEVQSGNLDVIAASASYEILVFALMALYYAILYLALALGGALLLWHRQSWALVICGLIPLWFIYLPGSAGNARFRAPIEGLLALVAAVGLVWAGQMLSRLVQRWRPMSTLIPHTSFRQDKVEKKMHLGG
jgi:hypothetical protein